MGPRRTAISNQQRATLRAWYRAQRPRPTYHEAIAWYEQRYHHRLSKSTVSESLNDKFKFLDKDIPPNFNALPIDPAIIGDVEYPQLPRDPGFPEVPGDPQGTRKPKFLQRTQFRKVAPEWPELDRILFLWYQKISAQGGTLTGDIITQQAEQIWKRLPSTNTKLPPKFSNGWLTRFKARHGLSQVNYHGEERGVPKEADEEMLSIIQATRTHNEQDIFNMDETGLYWRMAPSVGLSTERRGGIKKDKARISVALCCNANGSERLPPLVIGSARVPHALRGINLNTLGVVWRSNKKAWMTGHLMQEWLQSFYTYVGGRRVLLLLDNCTSHTAALQQAYPPDNVEVLFLPPNSTSRYQPMDQGIIQNFKVYYKKQWLQYMVEAWENGTDPVKEVTIKMALDWITQAWDQDVTCTTIRNCYRRSTILASPLDHVIPAPQVPDISSQLREAQEAGHITERMSLANFLNPSDESLEEEEKDPLEAAIAEVLGDSERTQETPEPQESENDIPIKAPTLEEALQSLHIVIAALERRPDGSTADLRALQRLKRYFMASYRASLKQGTMDTWLRG